MTDNAWIILNKTVSFPRLHPLIVSPRAKESHTLRSDLIKMDTQPVLTSFLLTLLPGTTALLLHPHWSCSLIHSALGLLPWGLMGHLCLSTSKTQSAAPHLQDTHTHRSTGAGPQNICPSDEGTFALTSQVHLDCSNGPADGGGGNVLDSV